MTNASLLLRVLAMVRGGALLFALFASVPSFAFKLDPISQVLSPRGSGARCSYQVVNDGSEPIAIAFSVAHLIKHLDGSEDLSQVDDQDFLVFPPQMVVPAGGTRTVRVRWLGDSEIDRERSYRFKAEQIPVDLDSPDDDDDDEVRAVVRFVYKFHGTLFVRPKGARPEIDVDEVELLQGVNGNGLRVRVANEGTMRGWIRSFVLRLSIGEETFDLTEDEVPELQDLPVLAGGRREVIVRWPAALPLKQPTAATMRVDYRPSAPR